MRTNCLIVSGPHTGSKVWVHEGQYISVGRTGDADFSFPNDLEMSSKHFSLHVEQGRCMLRDLQSTNGTFVEGRRVSDAELSHGGVFKAGQSVFAVEIEEPPAERMSVTDVHSSLHASSQRETAAEQRVSESKSANIPAQISGISVSPGGKEPKFLLRIRPNGGKPEELELFDGQSLVVGRTQAAHHVVASDPELSSLHFEVSVDGDTCFVRDLSSSNGTFVNDSRVSRQPVYDGDLIRAGRSTFEIAVDRAARDSPHNVGSRSDGADLAVDDQTPVASLDMRMDGTFDEPTTDRIMQTSADGVLSAGRPSELAPSDGGVVRLVCQTPGFAPQVVWLRDGEQVVFGASPEAGYQVEGDSKLAPKHFELISDNGTCVIRDLGSSAGTQVNGEPVVGQILSSGDVISAGATTFAISFPAESETMFEDGSPPTQLETSDIIPDPIESRHTEGSKTEVPPQPQIRELSGSLDTHQHIDEVPREHPNVVQPRDLSSADLTPSHTDRAGHINVTIHAPGAEPRVVWLRDAQQAVFGRSQEADVWVDTDAQLSSRHFEIISEGGACAIRDLDSRNGTFVNGQRITLEVLCDADVIEAGETRFVVATHAHAPSETGSITFSRLKREKCASGIYAFTGKTGAFEDLMSALGGWHIVNVVDVDDSSFVPQRWLYNWLPDNVARDLSPAVLSPDESARRKDLIKKSLGKKAVFGVISDSDFLELGPHLASVARGQIQTTGLPQVDRFVANHPFNELEELFRNGETVFADFVFSKIQALVFASDKEDQCVVLAREDFEARLTEIVPC